MVVQAPSFPFFGVSMLNGSLPCEHRGSIKGMIEERCKDAPEYAFAPSVSADAEALCRGLLDPSPQSRITGAAVREHPWLADVDWDRAFARDLTPPIQPMRCRETFDSHFTSQKGTDVLSHDAYGHRHIAYWSDVIDPNDPRYLPAGT